MAIMVAGGLTFAVPSTMPAAYAEVTTSNPHLYVSAEGQDADNQFAPGNIIEVIIRDDSIGDTDEGEAEPAVTINGADLRMLQAANGDWRAYFAQADAIEAIDGDGNELDYGVYCDKNSATRIAGGNVDLTDTNGVYFPPASSANGMAGCDRDTIAESPADSNHPLIRETRDLTTGGNGLGQLSLSSDGLWPFIQVFDFAPESKVNVVYNKGGAQETVTLEFDDPSESHSLDRTKYPVGAHVLVTIEDYALNIDPTDEDTWAFDTENKRAYYNLFDEDGDAENIMRSSITDYSGSAGIGEQIRIDRNPQGGNPVLDCQVTADFGIVNEDDTGMDYLMSNDESNGACVPTDNITSAAARGIFTADTFVIGFVEDGSNNNKFINWADDQRANLVVPDNAQRNRSFEIDYNDPGAISGVVGHFFAELTLGDAGATWNSGERIGITVTDEDVNTNPLAENDLTVDNPHSLLIPSIKIGNPITLADVSGNVTWYALDDPIVQDTMNPDITILGDNPAMVSRTNAYTDAGFTCTDDMDSNPRMGTPRSTVNINTLGNYTVTYTCTDSSGNTATAVRNVQVTSLPVITMVGGNAVAWQKDMPYADADVTCTDDDDGIVGTAGSNSSAIDTTKLGVQIIEYTCVDDNMNKATATKTVTITHLPKIDVGNTMITLEYLANYTDVGVRCTDAGDVMPSQSPVTDSNATEIDTAVLGQQIIEYTCTDGDGNIATATRTITVVDTTDPVIEFDQDPVMESSHNTRTYADAGVTCEDVVDGVITIITSNATGVDRAIPGSYVIEYSCTDDAENTATKTRTVTVEDDDDPPTITGTDTPVTLSRDTMASYAMMKIEEGVECTDNLDSNPTLKNDHTISVILATNDIYTVEFTCTDENTNVKTETRTVTVQDDIMPPTLDVSSVTRTLVEGESFDIESEIANNASCMDDVALPDGAITAVSNVDNTTTGTYTVVYSCTDASGNKDDKFVTVTVTTPGILPDTTNPVITGATPVRISINNMLPDGVGCTDPDGSTIMLTSNASSLDTSMPGEYIVTYTCTDNDETNLVATADRMVTVNAPTPTAPLEITRVIVPSAWMGDSTSGNLTITVEGQIEQKEATDKNYNNEYELIQGSIGLIANYTLDGSNTDTNFFNNSGDTNYFNVTVSNNGMIVGTVILDAINHSGFANKTTSFRLTADNSTAIGLNDDANISAYSDYTESYLIHPILSPGQQNVDMTTTPVSGNTAGFPSITRAVINDVSEIPGIHNVVHPSSGATHTFVNYDDDDNMPNDEVTVEDFSDRLRITVDHDIGIDMPTTSKLVIKHWDLSKWQNLNDTHGVRTLFNWDFGSIPNTNAGNIVIANASNHDQHVVLATGIDSSPHDITGMVDEIAELGHDTDLIIHLSVKPGESNHLCSDITLVADFLTFGQTKDERINNAIYRIEVEEVTPDNSDFAGTLEYVMLNQLNYNNSATYTGLRTIDVDASIIVHEDFTDEDSVRINYFDLGADGVATQIAVQQEAPTHSGVVSFDADNYKIADTVTITLEDADLNVDNDVVDIYTFDTSGNHPDMIGNANAFILDVTFDDEAWTAANCNGDVPGFASTGFTLMETASNSGIFTGDFQVPSEYCQKDTNSAVSVTGVDIEVNYQDFRDASGEEVEVGAGAAIRANTGTVSLDRTVYPVPFDPAEYGTATDNSLADYDVSGDLGVHIRVNDPDFDVSASGEDKIVNASAYLTVKIIRGAEDVTVDLGSVDILEVAPDAGIFELDLTISHDNGPDGQIQQGDIIQVEYRDETDASGEENTITDSATFDLRNAVLQSDKSVYLIGSDMILTLIEPDFDLDNDGAETYPLDLIEWDSDADTVAMGSDAAFDPEPNGLRETGDSTGIFQSIIEIPAELDGDRLERGEEIELEYVDYGPSGSDYVGDETEDINLTIATSNFGATVELDQKVYSWTDKVYITIVAPDHNFDSALVDEIGESDDDPIKVATRSADIDNYKLVETGPDTGIFTGEIILIGYDHNADGDTSTGTESTGYDNPQRETSGTGPTNGFIETDDEGGITVSFEFSEDETVVGSALIRWNIGEVQWLEASYPATGTGVVRVIDPDMNLNPESVDNFEVDIWSDKDAGGIDLTVTETNQATGIFEGTVFFTVADESSGHRLRVAEGNTVTAEYDDNTLPDPYTTADELGVTATTLIGSIVPPLERVPASNLRIVDAFENSMDSVSVDQQVQIVADITNAQERSQEFAYLVQVQDENGVTVSLAWISGTLEAGQSLSPSSSWIPTDAGDYTATAFVWESVDNPTALSPPVTTTITVS